MRTIHGPLSVGSLKCDHCGSEKFTRLNSLKEHVKGCENNPNREVFYCLVEGCVPKDHKYSRGEEQENPHKGPTWVLTCFQIELVNLLVHSIICSGFEMSGWTSGYLVHCTVGTSELYY